MAAIGIIFLLMPSSPEKEQPPKVDPPSPISTDSLSFAPPLASIDTFREVAYVTYAVMPQTTDIRIFNPDSGQRKHTFASVSLLAEQEDKSLQFIVNGGMFRQDRGPQGLLVIDEEVLQPLDTATQGYGNFYMQPNGIFAIDTSGKGYVLTTARFAQLVDQAPIQYATQSGPMMVIDGKINSLFNDGSPNKHIRNAVGLTAAGRVVFGISKVPVTFYDLSSLMIQKGCTQVLYLDGFVSQMFVPALGEGEIEAGSRLGPLIAIFE
ncbi:MAG: phosphodiester glycosidase family protein [Bacteroidota bacterium]